MFYHFLVEEKKAFRKKNNNRFFSLLRFIYQEEKAQARKKPGTECVAAFSAATLHNAVIGAALLSLRSV